jgi:NTE family protein
MINNLQQARLATARAAGRPMIDIALKLDRDFGLWETRAMPELFEAGRRAARAQLPQILAMLEQTARRSAP